ncbi:hypothetical protein F5Y09DRAFT_160455 [Xylaria sp. FL1042]|nr:hypothetical protein F5Y09DRAFT_160455 [Xylaria sp. FL1042]
MQVLGNQDHADRSHDDPIFAPYGITDPPFYEVNAPDLSFWRPPERVWHLDNFVTSHRAMNHYVYAEEQQQPPQPLETRTNGNDCHQVANLRVPFVEWPSDPVLDTSCDNNPIVPSIVTLYPPMPQNSLATLSESLALPQDMEWSNGPLSPVSPMDPKDIPTSLKKRNRNRLAAAKCRKKAKRGVDELQQRERDLLRENKMLNAQACLLREEVLQLKAEILRHNKCENDFISQYIQKTAKRVGVVSAEDGTCDAPSCSDL